MSESSESDATIEVRIDGEQERLEISEGESLMEAIRAAGHYSVVNGCSEGVCGSCNVMYGDNQIARSCLVPADRFDGEELTTAKGLGEDGELHPLQEAFLEYGAAQCGFCIPGMILSAVQLLEKNHRPTEEEVLRAINGNICRCTGYVQQVEAIRAAAARMYREYPEPVSVDE